MDPNRELVLRAMAGDRFAQDALWREHRRWVAAVLLAHLPRSEDLEDLLQEVAMKMVRKIHSLKSPESFKPWLRSVAHNLAVTAGRRQRVRGKQASLPEELVDPTHESSRRQEPVADRLDDMLRIIAGLHVDYREPLLMRCVQGMTQREIAGALDLPVTTVETRLARARRLLRAEASRDGRATPVTGDLR